MIQKILNYLKKLIPIDLDSMVLESSENDSNVYQKYGVAAAAGTAVALFSLFIMAFLIATGEVQLDEIKTRKIVDIVMPQRDPELLDSVERPEEAEPEPEQTPPILWLHFAVWMGDTLALAAAESDRRQL